jgi:hypothetical protein
VLLFSESTSDDRERAMIMPFSMSITGGPRRLVRGDKGKEEKVMCRDSKEDTRL